MGKLGLTTIRICVKHIIAEIFRQISRDLNNGLPKGYPSSIHFCKNHLDFVFSPMVHGQSTSTTGNNRSMVMSTPRRPNMQLGSSQGMWDSRDGYRVWCSDLSISSFPGHNPILKHACIH